MSEKKKKFEYMSQNEWLGDSATHFMKSGSAIRSEANKPQEVLATFVPKEVNGVKVEYDIAYDIPGKIHGYKFSDCLNKAIYLAPQSSNFALTGMKEAALGKITEEGKRVFDALRENMEDKYILEDDEDYEVDQIVVLPGTNLLVKDDIIDMDKIDRIVADGAFVKIHPITEKTWQRFLQNRWGKKVIPADAPLYPIIRQASKVWFSASSETGIAATILGKGLGSIDHPNKTVRSTFQNVYQGLDSVRNATLIHKMQSLLSHPSSGIVTTYHDDPEQRIADFFEYMSQFPHKA